MKISEVVTLVRDLLDDASANHWSDVQVVRNMGLASNIMFRWHVQGDSSYHNFEIQILGTDAVQFGANAYVYTMPRFTHKVIRVRETKPATDQTQVNFPSGSLRTSKQGWIFTRNKQLRMVGFSDPKDLTIDIGKIPARLSRGTVEEAGSATTLILQYDDTGFVFDEEKETE